MMGLYNNFSTNVLGYYAIYTLFFLHPPNSSVQVTFCFMHMTQVSSLSVSLSLTHTLSLSISLSLLSLFVFVSQGIMVGAGESLLVSHF